MWGDEVKAACMLLPFLVIIYELSSNSAINPCFVLIIVWRMSIECCATEAHKYTWICKVFEKVYQICYVTLWLWKINLKITSCVYHLVCKQPVTCELCVVSTAFAICGSLVTCYYGPRKHFLENYPMLQFTTTISIAFALR